MKKCFLLTSLALVMGCQIAPSKVTARTADQPPSSREPASSLKEIHQALFEMYFPLKKITDHPDWVKTALQVRASLWSQLSTRQDVRWGFRVLDAFSIFHGGFAHLTVDQREKVFHEFEVSPIARVRQAARFLRLFYLQSIYASDLGELISGEKQRPPLFVPDMKKFMAEHAPHLPPRTFNYDPKSQSLVAKKPFDVVIVGSGPAGSALAYELSRHGQKVLVLEQGAFVVPGAVDTRRIPDLYESLGLRTAFESGIIFRNGHAVGGGTAVNVDLAFSPLKPLIQARIEGWRKNHRIRPGQFTRPEMEKAYAWVKEKVGTRAVSKNEINANNRILWQGALLSGRTPHLYDLNTYAPGKSPSPVINKKSAVSAFLIPAMENKQNPLSLIPGAKVTKILWSDPSKKERAIGVEFKKVPVWNRPGSLSTPHGLALSDGQKVRVFAKRIILSAGSLGSPAILLKSGLKNPMIGAGLIAHPSIPLVGIFDQPIRAWQGTPASVYVDDHALTDGIILEAMTADVSYAAMMLPGDRDQIFDDVEQAAHIGGFGVMLIDTPSKNNRVSLDRHQNPVIHYTLHKKDAARFAHAIAQALDIIFRAGAQKVYLPTNELDTNGFTSPPPPHQIEQSLKFISYRTTLTSAHMQGTCKMGTNPKTSVVDTHHKVWGTENVYVVDSSVFPTSVGANPMQTIYTTAKIFADHWR